ncbi:MAG: methionyl-tRNA formyltransferase, partial [Anaerolineales bacterium]
ILKQKSIGIMEDDTTGTLTQRLAIEGANLLIETIPEYINGDCIPTAQDHTLATYAPMLKKEDGMLDFNTPSAVLLRKIRAYNPWPTAYTTLHQQRLIILEAQIYPQSHPGIKPGQTMIFEKTPMIATADSFLKLITIQLAGKKPVSGKEFLHGFRQWGVITLPS